MATENHSPTYPTQSGRRAWGNSRATESRVELCERAAAVSSRAGILALPGQLFSGSLPAKVGLEESPRAQNLSVGGAAFPFPSLWTLSRELPRTRFCPEGDSGTPFLPLPVRPGPSHPGHRSCPWAPPTTPLPVAKLAGRAPCEETASQGIPNTIHTAIMRL